MLKSEKKKYPKILASIAFSNYFSPHTLIISSVIRIVFKKKILLGVEQIWWLPSKILPISLNQQSFTLKTDNSFLLSLLLFCTNQPIPADYCRPFGGGYYWDCTWRLLNGGQALYLLCPAASIMLGTSFLYFENIFYYCFFNYVYVCICVHLSTGSCGIQMRVFHLQS